MNYIISYLTILPYYIYNPFNRKIWQDKQIKYNRVYNAILGRFVFGGNLLFFTSLITMIIKFYGYNLTNNLIEISARNASYSERIYREFKCRNSFNLYNTSYRHSRSFEELC